MTRRTDIHAARYEMLEWYGPLPIEAPWGDLPGVALAPGAMAAFAALSARGVRTAIVSITWTFAVEAFAHRLGADAWIGNRRLGRRMCRSSHRVSPGYFYCWKSAWTCAF